MSLHVLLAALVLAVLPALAPPKRRPPSRPCEDEVAVGRWPRWVAALQEFWNQQLHLHQLYLNSFEVSGGDALAALAQRKRPVSAPE